MSPEHLAILKETQGRSFSKPEDLLSEIEFCYNNIILKYMQPSPLKKSIWLSELTGGQVWLKLESLNPNGSFKVRGGLNALSRLKASHENAGKEKIKVCAASAGNHAQGVAFAAKVLGCEAHIFLPENSSLVKRAATERLGAKIYLEGQNLEEAFEGALRFSKSTGAFLIHAYNNYDIIIGQSTCAYECQQQFAATKSSTAGAPDYFVCSLGGGGLGAGASLAFAAMSTKTRVICIPQMSYNSAQLSLSSGNLCPALYPGPTIADGIAVGMIGNLNFDYLKRFGAEISPANENMIVKSLLGLYEQDHIIAEGAGAAAASDLLNRPHFYKEKTTIVCVSGGNISPQLLSRIISTPL